MKCSECFNKAVIVSEKPFCKVHFTEFFEAKVIGTVERFGMINSGERIAVGSSGGKDSTAALYILKKHFGNVHAISVDEGIPGYRNITLEAVRSFCSQNSIPLKVFSYKEEFGFSLAEALKTSGLMPCNVCGTLRRYLLNSKSKSFDKVVTGHNLDDEAQSVMMNLVKNQMSLLSRLGPVTGSVKEESFVPRVKPLYFCTEKEVAAYVILKKIDSRFTQCPHAKKSFRAFIRDRLNEYESKNKGSKLRLINNFLRILPRLKRDGLKMSFCRECGEPSSRSLCKTCGLVREISVKLGQRS